MLTQIQQDMIRGDFEKFLNSLRSKKRSIDFDLFGEYAVSILNFYVGSSLLTIQEKSDAADILVRLFNAGLGNRISHSDLKEIAASVIQDPTLDYSIIQPVFDL